MSDKVHDLSRKLTFWAMNDESDTHYVDNEVKTFVASVSEDVESLKDVEQKIAQLQEEKAKIAQKICSEFYKNIETVESKLKKSSNSDSLSVKDHALDDLAFWSRMKKIGSEIYSYLEPRWDDLERIVVSYKIKKESKERAKDVVSKK